MKTFYVIVGCLAIVIGFFLLLRVLRSKKYAGDEALLAHKNDLPILPRDQRQIDTTDASQEELPPPNETQPLVEDVQPSQEDALSNLAKIASQNELPTTPTDTTQKNHPNDKLGDYTQDSPVIDQYLTQVNTFEQNNSPLLNAKDVITIVITPRNHAGLSGKDVLKIVRDYGLRYGVMNMYHRYEHQDGTGDLWFSMLGATYDGMQPFDLNTLAESHFIGLSLFLALPHPHALRGFNSMASVARMIAKDLDADIHDEEGYVFDDAYFEKVRLQISDDQ